VVHLRGVRRHIDAPACLHAATALAVAALVVAGSTPEPASAVMNGLRGTISYASFSSRAIKATLGYAVYLPPGYAAGTVRYPVVYFLHGLPASPDTYRAITPIARAVEQAGRQAIVIGVQGARAGEADPEWLNAGPGHNWETAVAQELVSVVDSRYRTIADRSGRVIVGISGGGYGATMIALHHPGTFAVVESWSGYFHATDPTGTAALDLGSEEANDWADAHKLIPNVRTLLRAAGTYFAFYVGTNDKLFKAENVQFGQELQKAGLGQVVFRLYPGGHNWTLWSSHSVGWLAKALAVAAQPT
jgi:enterochelin esterase-like enzyme